MPPSLAADVAALLSVRVGLDAAEEAAPDRQHPVGNESHFSDAKVLRQQLPHLGNTPDVKVVLFAAPRNPAQRRQQRQASAADERFQAIDQMIVREGDHCAATGAKQASHFRTGSGQDLEAYAQNLGTHDFVEAAGLQIQFLQLSL